MASGGRSLSDARIVIVAGPGASRRLAADAARLELASVSPGEAVQGILERHTAVFAWLTPDAAEGLATMKSVRATRPDVRTLFVTPRAAEAERLAALEAGVDDVLAAPLATSELAGRLRLLLHRARPARRTRLPIAHDLELDLDRRELRRDGHWVHLRPKEAGLLELFARQPGRVFSRAEILERVWGPAHDGDPRTVDVHVRWLRSKIEPEPHDPVRLLTVRGVGYRLEPAAPLTER